MCRYLIVWLLVLSLQSCYNKEGIDISDYPVSTLEYNELPNKVKKLLENKMKLVDTYHQKTFYFSTDSTVIFKHYRKNTHRKGWLYEVNNNDDYFILNNQVYRKSGNNGDPYIYHQKNIYYCDYNTYLNNFKEKKYFKILLENRKEP